MYILQIDDYEIPVLFDSKIKGAKLYGKWDTFEVKCNPSIPRKSILEFINSRKKWMKNHIKQNNDNINKFREQINLHDYQLQDHNKEGFKKIIQSIVKKFKNKRGVVGRISINNSMKKNWATCSSKHNLTFNPIMCYLPEHLIEYIVYHEMCHLSVPSHNTDFYNLIIEEYPDYEDYDLELASYNYLITLRAHDDKIRQCKDGLLNESDNIMECLE